jgi:hypothetical protein
VSSPTPRSSSGTTGASPSLIPSPSPAPSPAAIPAPAATPSPTSNQAANSPGPRLVIADYIHTQVRLALVDATDIAAVSGQFDGVAGGQAIVVNGLNLMAVSRSGVVTTLGQLAGHPEWNGPGSVAVNPSLSQWIYTLTDTALTSYVHIGTPGRDSVLATVRSPDGYDFYEAFTWNASGAYLVKEGTGLGGVGPFLEYHFPLAKLDVSSGQITLVSPACTAEMVLDSGTFLCRNSTGGINVRPPSGTSHTIQLSKGTSGADAVYSKLTLTTDQRHVVAARNGSANPSLVNYQMVGADLSSTTASVFGPIDFFPDTWLSDGRLVADHMCWSFQGNGGPCDQSLDGTYFVSADGLSHTLFYKLAQGSVVVASM